MTAPVHFTRAIYRANELQGYEVLWSWPKPLADDAFAEIEEVTRQCGALAQAFVKANGFDRLTQTPCVTITAHVWHDHTAQYLTNVLRGA